MPFPDKVERWRNTVSTQVRAVLNDIPAYKSLTDRSGLSFDRLVDIILAIIQKESSGEQYATGDGGDSIGLMMLNYGKGTPQSLGYSGSKQDLFNSFTNTYYGTKYFLSQLDKYGSVEAAIVAYRSGEYTGSLSSLSSQYLNDVLSFLGEKKTLFFRSCRASECSYSYAQFQNA